MPPVASANYNSGSHPASLQPGRMRHRSGRSVREVRGFRQFLLILPLCAAIRYDMILSPVIRAERGRSYDQTFFHQTRVSHRPLPGPLPPDDVLPICLYYTTPPARRQISQLRGSLPRCHSPFRGDATGERCRVPYNPGWVRPSAPAWHHPLSQIKTENPFKQKRAALRCSDNALLAALWLCLPDITHSLQPL